MKKAKDSMVEAMEVKKKKENRSYVMEMEEYCDKLNSDKVTQDFNLVDTLATT